MKCFICDIKIYGNSQYLAPEPLKDMFAININQDELEKSQTLAKFQLGFIKKRWTMDALLEICLKKSDLTTE